MAPERTAVSRFCLGLSHAPGAADAPVPTHHSEPIERLLDAFRPDRVALLVQPAPCVRSDWLTQERLYAHLRSIPIEPVATCIWPLVNNIWSISICVAGDADTPANAVQAYTLCRVLARRLEEEWRAENLRPPLVLEGRMELSEETYAGETRIVETPLFRIMPVARLADTDNLQENIDELNAVLDVILNRRLHTQFQPVVRLKDGSVLGYEALIRGPKETLMRKHGSLFRAADKARLVAWLDIACQEQCFRSAAEQGTRHLLFVNMDAEGLAFLDRHERSPELLARDCGLSTSNIVIEVTERQAVRDFPRLARYLERLREQGFKIAIDDAGAGYNSLLAIAEARPDFIKVDRGLVRHIHAHGEKRALVAALVQFARHVGAEMLAEGVEAREEAAVLIDLEVPYAQGYLLGKPSDDFRGVPRQTRQYLQTRSHQAALLRTGRTPTIGTLAYTGKCLPPETPLSVAAAAFARDPGLTSITVTEDGFVRGLLLRSSLSHVVDTTRASQMDALLPNQTLATWMLTNFLQVEADERIDKVTLQVLSRTDLSLETDIVIVEDDARYYGVLPARVLIERTSRAELNRQSHADPLTGLPGRVVLDQELEDRLAGRGSLAVLRIDVNGLARFNRKHGIACGDALIVALSELLLDVSATHGAREDSLQHLGGDDFVLLTGAENAVPVCRALIAGFEALLPRFYASEAIRNGEETCLDRSGHPLRAALCSLAVAGVTNQNRRITTPETVAEQLGRLLEHVKRGPGSRFAVDYPPEDSAGRR